MFIGGNHEASNYLRELPYGGWVAPKIFYLGLAGVINVAGLRIAGLSGIYHHCFYRSGFFEREPYTKKTIDSVFLVRELQVYQLSGVTAPLDVFLSHDWARKIEDHGDMEGLLRVRPDFQASIDSDRFGNPGTEMLLSKLKPMRWLAGHMHVRFEATVRHDNEDASTQFLGLDKCNPGEARIEILDIPSHRDGDDGSEIRVMMDDEWLTILRKTHSLFSAQRGPIALPSDPVDVSACDVESIRARVREDFETNSRRERGKVEGEWPTTFAVTVRTDGQARGEDDQLQWGIPRPTSSSK